jgi:hypothetical protein
MTPPPDSKNRVDRAKRHIQLHIEQSNSSRHRVGSERLRVLLTAMIDFAPTPEGRERVAQSVIDCESWRDLVELYKLYENYIIFPSESDRYYRGPVLIET